MNRLLRKRLITGILIALAVVVLIYAIPVIVGGVYLALQTAEYHELIADVSVKESEASPDKTPYTQVVTYLDTDGLPNPGVVSTDEKPGKLEEIINGKASQGWTLAHIDSCAVGDKVLYTMVFSGGY